MANDKSWQSRIAEGNDALAQGFVESISYDRRLYKHDIAGSIAHAAMLAKVGLITEAERAAIEEGLKSIECDIESDNFAFDQSLEDIHMVIEAALIQRIGEPGKKLHTGRSRNDQVATDLLLWCKEATNTLQGAISHMMDAFVIAAERNAGTVMPCYTHLQRAQPIDAGSELLAWACMFDRDWTRLKSLTGEGHLHQTFPLGSGAIAGSTLPLDRRITQTLLDGNSMPTQEELNESGAAWQKRLAVQSGKQFLIESTNDFIAAFPNGVDQWKLDFTNSIEATANRDAACDVLYCCAMICMHLSRWAEQWIIYSTTEFGFIKISDKYTTGSSMMPQKRNPDMLELIRGRCGTVYGDLFALMTILKGLPIGYNRDLQEDKRIIFRAYDTVSACLQMATAIVGSAEFVKEKIEPTLERGFLDATSLAEYFVTKGIPFRTAHQIVGSLVAQCEREGKTALAQLSLDQFLASVVKHYPQAGGIGADVFDALGARNVVARYRSAGAAGGKPFEDQLAAWKKRLEK